MVYERSTREWGSRWSARSWFWGAALLIGCAPSDFDEVVQESHEPDVCDADTSEIDGAVCPGAELEAGVGARDGGESDRPGEGKDASDGDAATGSDRDGGAEESDAHQSEARDAAEGDASDADGGCSECTPDSGPAACGGQPAACRPNEPAAEMNACGNCGAGMQTRTRRCSADGCTWGAWSAWGACMGADTECAPGKMETQTEACGACGTGSHTRTRTCSDSTCTWSVWSAWGACSGVTAACSPGESMGCSPDDSCGHRVCQDDCTWSACVPIMPNGCLRRRNGTQEDGSNFRCCGGGAWQFCLPSCEWSTDCAACGSSCPEC